MKILICNAGSTSLKFKLYDMPAEEVLASGGVERVGSTDDAIYKYDNASRGVSLREEKQSVPDYETGIRRFLSDLTDAERGTIGSVADIDRVGFKTVLSRGYYGVHELTEPVLQGMRDMYAAAPAHNGPYLAAIEALRAVLPEAMFVGAFETDFHRTIPLDRCVYGVPYEWMEKYGVRRMGYHGASHSYVASLLNEWEEKNTALFRAISAAAARSAPSKTARAVTAASALRCKPDSSTTTASVQWTRTLYTIFARRGFPMRRLSTA